MAADDEDNEVDGDGAMGDGTMGDYGDNDDYGNGRRRRRRRRYCQHDRNMHDIIFWGFIANECSALRPESENNHGPSQLKGSRGPDFWFPAKYILSGTLYVHMYVGSSTIKNFTRKLTYHFYLRSIAEILAAVFSHKEMENILFACILASVFVSVRK